KNEGLIFAHGKPLRKVPQERLVDELFVEIDKSIARGKTEFDDAKAAEGAQWLEKIENENAGELTPERLAKLEAEQARAQANGEATGNGKTIELPQSPSPKKLDEAVSPTVGRRFTRA
ncbi:MAG: (E)-4-hydroxy-3-methylbut-2-enyl-diphosphate synthase, partial [Thermoleophilales bacterium]|nr:(E)-4-hydroxy-3-methylbut-2-enyl-diphosphate synthase [Thermoleophilales bacterium]